MGAITPNGPSLGRRSAFLRLAAREQVAPTRCADLDVIPLSRRSNPLPCPVALGIGNAFDLIETRDGVAHVARIGQRFLALFGERELSLRQVVLFSRAQPGAPRRRPFTAVRPRALRRPRLLQILSGGSLLFLGSHGNALLFNEPSNTIISTHTAAVGIRQP